MQNILKQDSRSLHDSGLSCSMVRTVGQCYATRRKSHDQQDAYSNRKDMQKRNTKQVPVGEQHTNTMVFNWPDFNKKYRHYWWLLPKQTTWGPKRPDDVSRWPKSNPPPGCTIMDPRDYPKPEPPLNRRCQDNIHEALVAEYDAFWPKADHLDLYWHVYASMTNRLITRIATKGLDTMAYNAYNPEIVVRLILDYLPSYNMNENDPPVHVPMDSAAFLDLAEKRRSSRKQKREAEKAKLQDEKERMELLQCLTCRAIELMLQRWDQHMAGAAAQNPDDTKMSATQARQATEERKRKVVDEENGRSKRLKSVQRIYKTIHKFL